MPSLKCPTAWMDTHEFPVARIVLELAAFVGMGYGCWVFPNMHDTKDYEANFPVRFPFEECYDAGPGLLLGALWGLLFLRGGGLRHVRPRPPYEA